MFISGSPHLSSMMSKQKTDSKVIHLNNGGFETQVLKSNVLVLVDFYADWCGPCHAIAPTIEALSNEFEGKEKFVKAEVEANQEVAPKYEIINIPTKNFLENTKAKKEDCRYNQTHRK